MEIENFNRLEDKINKILTEIKDLREENQRLKRELSEAGDINTKYGQEREELKNKVSGLIDLIDSIEKSESNGEM